MAKHDSPPPDPDSEVPPQDSLPDGYRVIRLPSWELRPPVAPIPNEEEGQPAKKSKDEFYANPINRRSSTSVNPPTHRGIPIEHRFYTDP